MSRATYILRNGELVLKAVDGILTDEYCAYTPPKPIVGGVIRDTLPGGINGILNHADGKRYDSKSQYERAVRARGCRVVGNDWNKTEYRRPSSDQMRGDFNVRPQLKQAIEKVLGS